ncbi:hypothetical protein [Pedobacter sp. Leaf132]|uniref:hypothetical protein n=1 Tax=Pedobacter sp. Leaf132 TaxID=2876557 RepID=UPI001E54AA59|nr:hypothetical protein [Pedobacter sp. Leaf132]
MMLSGLNTNADEEMIAKTAEVLEVSFIKNIEEQGFPNFSGLQNAFEREMIDENHCIITEICWFPDGGKSIQKLNTFKSDIGWKVLGLINEQ